MTNPSKDHYTDREFWQAHWKHFQPFVVHRSNLEEVLFDLPEKGRFIELGGFPGTYSIFFSKTYHYDVTLLDFYIDKWIVHKMETLNGLKEGTIHQVEQDLFAYACAEKYDMVFSYGLIEHFQDTREIINCHLALLKPHGTLLIILPNYLGLSGLFQKRIDQKSYATHNLSAMEINRLKQIGRDLGLADAVVTYIGKPHLWINSTSKFSGPAAKGFLFVINNVLQRIPVKSRFFSPLIAVKARKQSNVPEQS